MAVNGMLPDWMLETVPGTNRRVLRGLVEQTAALRDAFYSEFGRGLVITDAYRDFATQVRLKEQKGPFAATPGTSNHGWARALDLGSMVNVEHSPEHRWMVANGHRFGWRSPVWAHDNTPVGGQQEPWHWEADEVAVPVTKETGGVGKVPNAPVVKPLDPLSQITRRNHLGDDMVIYAAEGANAPHGILAHNGGFSKLANKEEQDNIIAAGGKVVWVTLNTLQNLITDVRA